MMCFVGERCGGQCEHLRPEQYRTVQGARMQTLR